MQAADTQAHSLGRNLISNFAGSLGSRLATSLLVIVLARFAGARDLGIYVLAVSFTTLFSLLQSDTSVAMAAVRQASQEPGMVRVYLDSMPLANLAIGSVMLSATLAIGWALYHRDPTLTAVVVLLAVSVFLRGLTAGLRWYFKVAHRFDQDAMLNWVTSGTSFLLGLAFLAITRDLRWFCVGIATGSLVGLVYCVRAVERLSEFRLSRLRLAWEPVRPLLHEVLPYAAMTVVVTIMLSVDVVLLGRWRSYAEVGIYGASLRLVAIMRLITYVTLPVLFPVLAAQWKTDREAFLRTFGYGLVVLAWIGGGIASCLSFASLGLVEPVFGARFAAAAAPTSILGWSVLLSILSGLWGFVLIAQERVTTNLRAVSAGLCTEIAACLVLIPRWGAVGAAYASVLTELVVTLILIAHVGAVLRDSSRIWRLPAAKTLLAMAAGAATGQWARGLPPVAATATAMAAFVGVSVAARVLTRSDLHEVAVLLRQRGAAGTPAAVAGV